MSEYSMYDPAPLLVENAALRKRAEQAEQKLARVVGALVHSLDDPYLGDGKHWIEAALAAARKSEHDATCACEECMGPSPFTEAKR